MSFSSLVILQSLDTPPAAPSLNSPADAVSLLNVKPVLNFTGTDINLSALEYNIQISLTSDFIPTFAAMSAGAYNWDAVAVNYLTGDVFGCATGGDIYKNVGGVGVFDTPLYGTQSWQGIAVNPTNGDVYTCVSGGDIYKQTAGTGDFVAQGAGNRAWHGVAVNYLTGDVFACVNTGYLYKQTAGSGSFTQIATSTSRAWNGIAVNSITGDVFGAANSAGIYKQTAGSGSFNSTGAAALGWQGVAVNPNTGDVFGLVWGGDIYKQTAGTGSFVAMGAGTQNWAAIAVNQATGDIFAVIYASDIYKWTPIVSEFSDVDVGFSAGHPYSSGSAVTYTVQTNLIETTYYWRVAAKDPDGSGSYGQWSNTYSFSVRTRPEVILNTPSDTATVSNRPVFDFTGTSAYAQPLDYNLRIDKLNTFNTRGNEFGDDFDDNSLDANYWDNWSNPGTLVSETNNHLEMYSGTASTWAGIYTDTRYTIEGCAASIQLVSAGNQSIASWEIFPINLVTIDGNHLLGWTVNQNMIGARKNQGMGVVSLGTNVAYNSSIHKYFRIRESNGTVYWDWSTDGSTWTNHTSVLLSTLKYIDITQMRCEIQAHNYNAETLTTTAIFDNFHFGSEPYLNRFSYWDGAAFLNPNNSSDLRPFDSGSNIQMSMIESGYPESNVDAYHNFTGGVVEAGQSFLARNGLNLYSIKFYLKKYGSPTGNIVVKIYAHSGTLGISSTPLGVPLVTSDSISITTLSTTPALTEFIFSTPYRFSSKGSYVATVSYSGGNASNYLQIGKDTTAPSITDGGNFVYNDGKWRYDSSAYAAYYVYSSMDPGTYYWKVRGIDPDGSGVVGPWSPTRSFTISGSAYNAPRILTVGDSITVGIGSTEHFGFRKELQNLLGIDKYSFVGTKSSPGFDSTYSICHFGIQAQRTDQIEALLSAELTASMTGAPSGSMVLLHLGTNDINQTYGAGIASYVTNVQDMIDMINTFNPAIAIYVAQIVPTTNSTYEATTVAYNAALATMINTRRQTKSNLYLVDMHTPIVSNPTWSTSLMYDTYHPNDLGYKIMAKAWYSSIVAPTVVLNTPADSYVSNTTTPTLNFTGIDPSSRTVEYNVQISKTNSFDSFVNQGFTVRDWYGVAVNPINGDVYATITSGDIYKQTGGVGDFVAIGAGSKNWRGIAINQSNGDVFACAYGDYVYKQTGGIGTFDVINSTVLNWNGVAVNYVTGDVYALGDVSDIYKQAGGSGGFVAMGAGNQAWQGITVDPVNNDIYAACWNGDIYRQTGGTGSFVPMGADAVGWIGLSINPATGDLYATADLTDIYCKPANSGSFVPMNVGALEWRGIACNKTNGDVYAMVKGASGNIYKKTAPTLAKYSITDPGFTAGHPFTSGSAINYTVQAADYLPSSNYYWRVCGVCPVGPYYYGTWSASRNLIVSAGGINVWSGSGWVIKPVKVWTGSQWTEKPVKVWTGSSWVVKG